MPIKPEMRRFYPSDWPQISRRVRFERADGGSQPLGPKMAATRLIRLSLLVCSPLPGTVPVR